MSHLRWNPILRTVPNHWLGCAQPTCSEPSWLWLQAGSLGSQRRQPRPGRRQPAWPLRPEWFGLSSRHLGEPNSAPPTQQQCIKQASGINSPSFILCSSIKTTCTLPLRRSQWSNWPAPPSRRAALTRLPVWRPCVPCQPGQRVATVKPSRLS